MSAKFRIFETDEFARHVGLLDRPNQIFIRRKLEKYVYPQLCQEPHFGNNIKKLHDYSPETLRYRIGDFRLFYSVNDPEKIVNMLTVYYRKDAY